MSEEIQDLQGAEEETFDMFSMFTEQSSSSNMGAGIHENVRLISVDTERRKDNNGNIIKKQLFLKFKRFNKDNEDVGEKDISFFIVDPAKDSNVNNLHSFISQVREILSLYFSEEEIIARFDPLSAIYDAETDEREEAELINAFLYDNIKKKTFKKASMFGVVEKAVCDQFGAMVEPVIGFESTPFRFKLEESQDAKYIQIPRFDRFVEKQSVKKEKSILTK